MLELVVHSQIARDLTAAQVRPVARPNSPAVPEPQPRAARTRRQTGRVLHALAARIEPRGTVVGA